MTERTNLEHIQNQERINSGTSWTNNEQFDKDGYLVVKNLWDHNELFVSVPRKRGQVNFWGKKAHQYKYTPLEMRVEGSFACYTCLLYTSPCARD